MQGASSLGLSFCQNKQSVMTAQLDIGHFWPNEADWSYTILHQAYLTVLVLLPLSYFDGSHFSFRTDQDASTLILNSMDSTSKLQLWQLRLSEFEFYVFHRIDNEHQATDTFLHPKKAVSDQTQIDDDISGLCITPSNPSGNKKASVSYRWDYDVNEDKEAVRLPKVYAITNSTGSKFYEQEISTNGLIHEQERFIFSTNIIYFWFTEINNYLWHEWILDPYRAYWWCISKCRSYIIWARLLYH